MNEEIFEADPHAAALKRQLLSACKCRNLATAELQERMEAVRRADKALTNYLNSLESGAA